MKALTTSHALISVRAFIRDLTELLRDWSLITGRGGGGHVKFYPYESGRGDIAKFSCAEGWVGTNSFRVVFMW